VAQVDTAEVGALLLQRWRFPDALVDAIRWQHHLDAQPAPMTAAVFAANQISKKLDMDFGGSALMQPESPALERLLGATLSDIVQLGGDWSAIAQEARRFSRL
jgi:HD-like signal output (HDOD) protein